MRETDDFQATITLGPVNRVGQDLSASLELMITLPMPDQDEHLPDTIEATVHAAGLEVQRRLFRALIEKADRELVLEGRDGKGGAGIQRRGTRPFTFKTSFGSVTVERCRISHKRDGAMEIPSASAWGTSHQLAITGNLRDAVCDQMSEQSSGASLEEICEQAGEPDLLGRSTVIEIVHEQGGRLIAAERQRARAILDGASEAERAALGPSLADDPDRMPAYEPDDDPPLDPEDPEWQQAPPPEWVVTGFPGCDPSPPVPPRGTARGGRHGGDRRTRRGQDQGATVDGPQGDLDVHGGGAGGGAAGTRWRTRRRRGCGCRSRRCCWSWRCSAAAVGCWCWGTGRRGSGRGSRAWGSTRRR